MKILVAIANHGTGNRQYLDQLLDEYRRMRFDVDVVVLSNIPKDLGPDVEILVGLPSKNPWSLPFGHRQLFADRVDDYDLFIYTEDDTLTSERNIDAFLEATKVLHDDEVAGFMRSEVGADGTMFISTVHSHFHWDRASVRTRGGRAYASFTNEHSACFLLTKVQLKRCIASGGFLVPPHEGRYDMLCSAATDPYTRCGLVKLFCISEPDDFLLQHLPNKYLGQMGVEASEFRGQLHRLEEIGADPDSVTGLLEVETKIPGAPWSKSYYEPCREGLLEMIPPDVKAVLSVGCGWGATERSLIERDVQVVGLSLDPVIAASAELRGVETVCGGFVEAIAALRGRTFDCLLMSNVLHLVADPIGVLGSLGELLSAGGVIVASAPNHSRLPTLWRRLRGLRGYQYLGEFDRSGLQCVTARRARTWFNRSGFAVERVEWVVPPRFERYRRWTLGLAAPLLASELVLRAGRG